MDLDAVMDLPLARDEPEIAASDPDKDNDCDNAVERALDQRITCKTGSNRPGEDAQRIKEHIIDLIDIADPKAAALGQGPAVAVEGAEQGLHVLQNIRPHPSFKLDQMARIEFDGRLCIDNFSGHTHRTSLRLSPRNRRRTAFRIFLSGTQRFRWQ
jgi:hypothetical protein